MRSKQQTPLVKGGQGRASDDVVCSATALFYAACIAIVVLASCGLVGWL